MGIIKFAIQMMFLRIYTRMMSIRLVHLNIFQFSDQNQKLKIKAKEIPCLVYSRKELPWGQTQVCFYLFYL